MDQVLQARSMPDLIRFEIDGSMHICVLVGILQVAGVSGLLLSCVHVLQLVHHGPLSTPLPPPPAPLPRPSVLCMLWSVCMPNTFKSLLVSLHV